MTITQTISDLENRINLQEGLFNCSSSDGARMRCMMTIETYKARIQELKNL